MVCGEETKTADALSQSNGGGKQDEQNGVLVVCNALALGMGALEQDS